MILSPKVDLTADRAFSTLNMSLVEDTVIDMSLDEYQSMTSDQYDKLMWFESIFGKRRHYNKKKELFGIGEYDEHFLARKGHCARCGSIIREPWNYYNGLCKDCATKLDDGKDNRTPWLEQDLKIKEKIAYENSLFNLFNSK